MAKISKKAEILDTLHGLIRKEAELAQTNISGEPGKDTKVTSVSDSTETTNKNDVGPEKLNDKQKYEQKPASDPSEPVANAKSAADASSIDKAASDILELINTKLAATAQTNISGAPGKDTNIQSVSDSAETTDKNAVGPEKLNDKQKYEQKPSTDKSEPVANAKSAEEIDNADLAVKVASFNFGSKLCEAILKKASELKTASEKQADSELLKEAGRRDFDTLIAQAAAELEHQQEVEAHNVKVAEAQGAAAFDELVKQAQIEAIIEENNALKVKLAEYTAAEEKVKAEQEKIASEKREADLAAKTASIVIEALKREALATAQPAGK